MAGRTPRSTALSRSDAISRTARRPAHECGFFFDFDGTLSSIVLEPSEALPADGIVAQLNRLYRLGARVSVVSARPVDFLRQHFAEGINLYGLYGIERGSATGPIDVDPAIRPWEPVMAAIAVRARTELEPLGITVEDKRWSVALHYRAVPDREETVRAWATDAAGTHLRIVEGRMVVELITAVDYHKGTVVAAQLTALSSAWYFGDDVADIVAFDAVTGERDRRPGFLGVAVAVRGTETPPEVVAAADFAVGSPGELVELLSALTGGLGRPRVGTD